MTARRLPRIARSGQATRQQNPEDHQLAPSSETATDGNVQLRRRSAPSGQRQHTRGHHQYHCKLEERQRLGVEQVLERAPVDDDDLDREGHQTVQSSGLLVHDSWVKNDWRSERSANALPSCKQGQCVKIIVCQGVRSPRPTGRRRE